jgi:hypothetical protein
METGADEMLVNVDAARITLAAQRTGRQQGRRA